MRHFRRDGNQSEIVSALEQIGVGVHDCSQSADGLCDILAVYRGKLYALEIKNPEGRGNRLTTAQVRFHAMCAQHGYSVPIVETVAQALAIFGAR